MSSSSGSSSWRTRLRTKRASSLSGSSIGSSRRAAHSARVSCRRRPSSGRVGVGPIATSPSEPGAAQQVDEHRLGPVVGGVAGEGAGREGGVTGRRGPEPRGWGRRPGRDAPTERRHRRRWPGRRPGRPRRPTRPQPVVDVDGRDASTGRRGQRDQGGRVRSAGEGARDRRAGGREGTAGEQLVEHGVGVVARQLSLRAGAPAGVLLRRDVLQVAGDQPEHGQHGHGEKDDADPPVPDLGGEHAVEVTD